VIFVTGHGAGADEPDWRALAATRMTIVVYMGIRRLDAIAAALRDGGLPGDTPCAAIEQATRDAQRHVVATLDTLVERVGAAGIGSPAIVVIGRVAALADAPAVRAALDRRE
jgi:uroporphyrin-III C-methyltransferase